MITFGVKQIKVVCIYLIKSIKSGSTTAFISLTAPLYFTKVFAFFVPEMSKKTFISTILLFAISLVLVHNIIPHHHHDKVSDISHHEHHYDKQDHNHQGENDEPIGFFSHTTHLITTTELSFTFSNNNDFQKAQTLKQYIKNTDIVFRQPITPKKPEPTQYIFFAAKQSFKSAFSLRGPPALSM